MNIELKNKHSNPDLRKQIDIKDANKLKEQGDSELKTSCLFCKFKPNCEDAIPFFKQATDMFHSAGQWKSEVYCREKLIFCFRTLKSTWEEGDQHEKLAYVHLLQFEDKNASLTSIKNAYQCFFLHGDYKDAVNSVKKLGHEFLEKEEGGMAENILKIAYEAFLQVFHTLATKKNEPYEFLYAALDEYLAILYKNNRVRIAIEALNNVLKVILEFSENRSQMVHVYGFLLISLLINEDEAEFKSKSDSAKEICTKTADYRFIENIDKLYEAIKEGKDNKFRDCMIEVNVDYPNEIGKQLTNLFYDRMEKAREMEEKEKEMKNDAHIRVNGNGEGIDRKDSNEGDDGLIIIVNENREGDDYL